MPMNYFFSDLWVSGYSGSPWNISTSYLVFDLSLFLIFTESIII